jgi:hypothetical protein
MAPAGRAALSPARPDLLRARRDGLRGRALALVCTAVVIPLSTAAWLGIGYAVALAAAVAWSD